MGLGAILSLQRHADQGCDLQSAIAAGLKDREAGPTMRLILADALRKADRTTGGYSRQDRALVLHVARQCRKRPSVLACNRAYHACLLALARPSGARGFYRTWSRVASLLSVDLSRVLKVRVQA